jgi:subtilisin family serine protease
VFTITPNRAIAAAAVALGATALAVAVAGPAARAVPELGTIRTVAGAQVVGGSYIVKLKDGRSAPTSITSVVTGHGAKVARTFTHALEGYSIEATELEARRIAADPAVDYVQRNARFHISETGSWGIDRIDQRDLPLDGAYNAPGDGSGVTAFIIDTGIRTSHSEFGGRASTGTDTVGDGQNGQDCHGHGTHVAGTVGGATYGVAKNVDLVAVRVLDCEGSGTTEGVVAGVDWVTANHNGPSVANMSLGGPLDPALDDAVANSIASGVTYAIAAGNGNIIGLPQDACTVSPARTPEAITVGATQIDDNSASFSNNGMCLDMWAPGVDITSAWNTDDNATNTISGTSMATPHVTGAAALYLSGNPGASPQEVRDGMVANATPDHVANPGLGSPNALLYVGG